MEIEYSPWINEFFCSPDCATDRYFNYMESRPIDFENTLPEGVIVNGAGVLVRAVEHSYAADGGYCPHCKVNGIYDGCCINCGVPAATANN